MLVQFSVENFKSFNELTVWSLKATADARLPHHVVTNEKGKGGAHFGVLRAAAIYGANAAGKSNLVLAMSFAQRLILNGTRGEERIGVQTFKLGDGKEKPSRFEFIFRYDDVLYSYGFAATTHRIHEEWLFATYTTKETRLFERITDDDNKTVAKFGTSLKRSAGGGFLDFIAQGTRPNQLLLTECFQRNVTDVKSAYEWFNEVLLTIRAETHWREWPLAVKADDAMRKFAADFLQLAGTGIAGIESEEIPVDADTFFNFPSDEMKNDFLRDVAALGPDEALMAEGTKGRVFVMLNTEGDLCRLDITTVHCDSNGKNIRFRLTEESEGTQRLFHLVPALYSLKKHPRVLIIDELDRRLHPLLTRLFVQTSLDCRDDDPQGQLLFTTHDTNLLDLDLLRRDEIWFVEKDDAGATHLASLAEWKIRPDLEVEKGYLNGRFGAIPFFGDISKLLCEPEKSLHKNVGGSPVLAQRFSKPRISHTSAEVSDTTAKSARRKTITK